MVEPNPPTWRPKYPPVMVFEDPITRNKPEGEAYVIFTDEPPDDGMVMATVWFVDDKIRGEREMFRRRISVDQLTAVGMKVG
jgi:hypothetical protein